MNRKGKYSRETLETFVEIEVDIDGTGQCNINTGIGFFDHMLNSFAKHGLLDLNVLANGDLEVDGHHTIEDVGIVLGKVIKKSLGDKKSIKRFGSKIIPLDDALVMCAIDLGGRPYLMFDAELPFGKLGDMEIELVEEFFRAFSNNAEMNLHIKVVYGKNIHHIVEAMFKAVGIALEEAAKIDKRIESVRSTKGVV